MHNATIKLATTAGLVLAITSGSVLGAGKLLVGNDQTAASIWSIDLANANASANVLSTAATSWGMAYDYAGTVYFNNGTTLRKGNFNYAATAITGDVTVGTIRPAGSTTAFSVTGLAYDTSASTLYGYRSVTAPGFYSIKTDNGEATLVAATPTGTDFGGFDYDPATNAFYALNDSTGLQGRGLYKITGIASGTPTYTLVTAYPTGDTDIDGLAVGNGRAYFVNDGSGTTAPRDIYVFNLTTLTYEANIPTAFTATNGIFSAGAFIPIPEPTTLALAGGLALGLLRRRSK